MNGIIIIDKEKGVTSRDVVNIASKKLNTKKIGHTGTLDPIATGVLVLCIGKATKISELITSYDKTYLATIKLGIETNTLDITGETIKEREAPLLTEKKISEVLDSFLGVTEQEVPSYSAVKIKGKKLYEYARNNIEIELPKRKIEVYNIKLIDYKNNLITFQVKVSKGTYIRSLIKDICLKLKTIGTMSDLRRLTQGDFLIEQAIKIEELDDKTKLISINEALKEIQFEEVFGEKEAAIKNGKIMEKDFSGDLIKYLNQSGEVIAIYKTYLKDKTKIKPYKTF
ncbi:MAG: tRNA pseudouridine(55) synthase TruB [Mollicutes bacterium]|nr:tRNA pseudouridine(55) synthase TruB [Mollicutes bacterium]